MPEYQVLKALDSLHRKLLQSKFACQITEKEMLAFVYAKTIVQGLANLDANIECEPGYFDGEN